MSPDDPDIADRFRTALAAQPPPPAESPGVPVDLDAARQALFERMGRVLPRIPGVGVSGDANGTRVTCGLRALRFVAVDEGVDIVFEGWPGAAVQRARPLAALSGRWVLHFTRHGREQTLPFFDQGLEELLVHGLGLPRPAPDERPMGPRTAHALSGAPVGDSPSASSPPVAPSTALPSDTKPRKRRDL